MNWDNIIYGKDNYQYQKCEHCKVPEGVPYECNSIMHYEQDTYKKMNKGPTMYGKKAGAPNFCSKNFQVSREPTANDWLSLNVRLGCNKNWKVKKPVNNWQMIFDRSDCQLIWIDFTLNW